MRAAFIDQRSGWPAEGLLHAQADFAAMPDTPASLAARCERCLSVAQRIERERAVRKATAIGT